MLINFQCQVLDYSYKKIIQSESELHPVLFSEAPWNKKDRREQVRINLGPDDVIMTRLLNGNIVVMLIFL